MSTDRQLTPDQNEALSAVRQAAGEVALRQSLTDQAEDDLDLRCAEALDLKVEWTQVEQASGRSRSTLHHRVRSMRKNLRVQRRGG